MIRLLAASIAAALPWKLKRFVYKRILGWHVSDSARIGLSLVLVEQLAIGERSRIGHFNVFKGCRAVTLGDDVAMGNFNWVTAHPEDDPAHFADVPTRAPVFEMFHDSAVTSRHIFDCTDRITIGSFATVAGYRSQFLTHAIDLTDNRQRCAPISIGDHAFVGTSAVILPGSRLEDRAVLGALSLLRTSDTEEYGLYSGVPATRIKTFDRSLPYFSRRRGAVE